ncbi:MAG: holin, BlyA family protein [Lachnospiraceae bacterium]|nr:holin, BlyA family protein [Lachnospiraceae bacterium]
MFCRKDKHKRLNEHECHQDSTSIHKNNAGIGVVEIILILVILIAIVLIFREKITAIVNSALQTIETDSGTIIGTDE